LDADGDRRFVSSNKGGVQHGLRLSLTEVDLDLAQRADVVHTSVYSSLEDRLADLAAAAPVSFDFSDEHSETYLELVCPHLTHAFFSGAGLSGPQAEALAARALELGCSTAVVTLGADGAWVAGAGTTLVQQSHRVDPVDTLGAGDGFIAGFLVGLYAGAGPKGTADEGGALAVAPTPDLVAAAEQGAWAAARACGFNGAFGRAMDFDDIPETQRPVAMPLA
jgi:fructoselysine 6-kinase